MGDPLLGEVDWSELQGSSNLDVVIALAKTATDPGTFLDPYQSW
jgi:hypothetical protein